VSRVTDGVDLRAKVVIPRLNNAETGTSNVVSLGAYRVALALSIQMFKGRGH